MSGVRWSGVLALTVCVTASVSAADVDLRTRFEAEAPAAWEAYREANKFSQGVCRGEGHGSEGKPHRAESEWKVNETCRSVRVTDPATDAAEVFAENPRYTFRLKNAPGRGWVLVWVQLAGEPESGQAQDIRRRLDQYGSQFGGAVRLRPDGLFLADLLRSDRVRVTAVAAARAGGAGLVEVRFDRTPDPAEPRKLVGGVLLLDPARGWLPVTATALVKTNVATGTHTTEYELGPGPTHPVRREVERAEYVMPGKPEPWRHTWASEWDLRVPGPLPDTRDFTLSAYGLPEPVGVTWARPTPRYVWFLLAAGGFVLLAVGFRYLARRRAAPVAAAPAPA